MAVSTKRVNITIPDQVHELAKQKAQELYGGNVSRLMTDALLFYIGVLEGKERGRKG